MCVLSCCSLGAEDAANSLSSWHSHASGPETQKQSVSVGEIRCEKNEADWKIKECWGVAILDRLVEYLRGDWQGTGPQGKESSKHRVQLMQVERDTLLGE